MVQSMLIASLGIVGMMLAWIGVQTIWRRMFAGQISDEDVLAERRSCGDCGCTTACSLDKRPGRRVQGEIRQ